MRCCFAPKTARWLFGASSAHLSFSAQIFSTTTPTPLGCGLQELTVATVVILAVDFYALIIHRKTSLIIVAVHF